MRIASKPIILIFTPLNQKMQNVVVYDHPLIIHKLGYMRDVKCSCKDFKDLLYEITMLMAYELTRDLPSTDVEITTPLEKMTTKRVDESKICIVPVLRAGLGMAEGVHKLIPKASVGHLGMQRDHVTLKPNMYYQHLPPKIEDKICIITDPMLATGGSILATIDVLQQKGVKNIKVLSLIAAPEGIKIIHDKHPEITIYTAQLDRCLNEKGYILPGLGDAGDRIFGTVE